VTNETAARNMLVRTFGHQDGGKFYAWFRRLLANQRERIVWLRRALQQGAVTEGEILVEAAENLLLLRHLDPEPVPEAQIISAWAMTMKDANQRAYFEDCGRGEPREHTLTPEQWFVMTEQAAEHDCPQEAEPFNLDGVSDRGCAIMMALASSLPPAQIARMLGLSLATVSGHIRRAFGHMVVANPWLIERFDLTPCPDHQGHRHCAACGDWGWLCPEGVITMTRVPRSRTVS
jgi:DNA-binding CsgD family transcriptional regulator